MSLRCPNCGNQAMFKYRGPSQLFVGGNKEPITVAFSNVCHSRTVLMCVQCSAENHVVDLEETYDKHLDAESKATLVPKAKHDEIRTRAIELAAKVADLREKLKTYHKKNEDLCAENARFGLKIADLLKDNADLKETLEASQHSAFHLGQENTELMSEVQQLRVKVKLQDGDANRMEECEELHKRMHICEKENLRILESWEVMRGEKIDLSKKNAQLTYAVEQLERRLAVKDSERDADLKEECEELHAKTKKLESAVTALEKECEILRDTARVFSNKLNNMTDERDTYKQVLADIRALV